jgi:predicted nucleotide-binding protein (sugar kinase/HSP70/actin superfamily)
MPSSPTPPAATTTPAPPQAAAARVAVLGNPAVLHTSFLNDGIAAKIRADGCEPVLLPLELSASSDALLEDYLPWAAEQGICDIIYVQSFGCLASHILGRGAMKRIRAEHPEVNITFIDYDPGASEVNQLNRLKLALSIARQRTAAG